MEKSTWTDRVINEVLSNGKVERIPYEHYKEGRLTGLVTSYAGTAFEYTLF
jgi:hypothetical protein